MKPTEKILPKNERAELGPQWNNGKYRYPQCPKCRGQLTFAITEKHTLKQEFLCGSKYQSDNWPKEPPTETQPCAPKGKRLDKTKRDK